MTRSVPNSCTSPVSVLKGWPASATSSPMMNTRGSRRISSASASRTASPYVSSLTATSGVDILVHLARLGVRRRQRELHAAVDLGLHVGQDALQGAGVGEPLRREAPGQGLERIALRHPLPLFFPRAVLAVDVADVVAVVPVGLALDEGRPLATARALAEPTHRRVAGLDVLAVDALGVDAEGPGARQDVAGDGLAARRVLAVEVVLADVDDGQLPERGHVHRLVEHALAQRAVAEEAHGDLRSEEHTSELQSRSDLVCRLLLEKKKKKQTQHNADGGEEAVAQRLVQVCDPGAFVLRHHLYAVPVRAVFDHLTSHQSRLLLGDDI